MEHPALLGLGYGRTRGSREAFVLAGLFACLSCRFQAVLKVRGTHELADVPTVYFIV